jgi:hypothetical protein
MMATLSSRTAYLPLALAALALLGSSCRRGPACFPVHGQMFVGNEPAAGALVVFVPTGDKDPMAPRPSATVAEDGSFVLRTYDSTSRTVQDGAPPGSYGVTVLWPPAGGKEQRSVREDGVLPDRLNGRYSDAASPQLQAEVKECPNELPAFRLPALEKSKKR